MTIAELRAQLGNPTYTVRTDDEIKAQAEQQYAAELAAKKLAAQQSYDATDTALKNQYATLDQSYAKQASTVATNTRQSYSAADRQALSRGMQRSSYNNATLSNVNLAGDKAQSELQQSRTNDVNNLESQRSTLARQLAESLQGYDTQNQSNVLAYVNTLKDQDYQRKTAAEQNAANLALQLYQLQLSQQEYDALYGSKTRSSSSGNKPKAKATTGGSIFDNVDNSAKAAQAAPAQLQSIYTGGYIPAKTLFAATVARTNASQKKKK